MKVLITLLAGLMAVGCAGEGNLSAMARLGSAAVFHTKTKPNRFPWRQGGDRFASWLFEIALVLVRLDHVARGITISAVANFEDGETP